MLQLHQIVATVLMGLQLQPVPKRACADSWQICLAAATISVDLQTCNAHCRATAA